MGNCIGLGLLFKAVCFDFRSTNVLGKSVIGTHSTTGFYVITLNSPTFVESTNMLLQREV